MAVEFKIKNHLGKTTTIGSICEQGQETYPLKSKNPFRQRKVDIYGRGHIDISHRFNLLFIHGPWVVEKTPKDRQSSFDPDYNFGLKPFIADLPQSRTIIAKYTGSEPQEKHHIYGAFETLDDR